MSIFNGRVRIQQVTKVHVILIVCFLSLVYIPVHLAFPNNLSDSSMSTFNGRVRRVRINQDTKKGIKYVGHAVVENDPSQQVRTVSFEFQDYSGPNPSPNPLLVPFKSYDAGNQVSKFSTDILEFDANALDETYTIVAIMRDVNGNQLGSPQTFPNVVVESDDE